MCEKNADALLNLNVERTVFSKRALDGPVFEGCRVVPFYISIKVTFLRTLDQKSEFENPRSVAKPTEGGSSFADSQTVGINLRDCAFIFEVIWRTVALTQMQNIKRPPHAPSCLHPLQ